MESSPRQLIAEQTIDVLIERLHGLILRLLEDKTIGDSTLFGIRAGVDQIELLVKDADGQKRKPPEMTSPSALKHSRHISEDSLRNSPHRAPTPLSPFRSMKHLPQAENSSAKAIEIANAAENLNSRLLVTVTELQSRRKESDHVHNLLIDRAAKAAKTILVLEYRIKELEEDFDTNQSELKFLRIQLHAMEAQCAEYMPYHEDDELSESIKNWRVDWEEINERTKSRRARYLQSQSNSNELSESERTFSLGGKSWIGSSNHAGFDRGVSSVRDESQTA